MFGDGLRIVSLLALIGFYLVFVVLPRARKAHEQGTPEESTSLLGNGAERAENGHANRANEHGSYGSVHPVGGKHQHTEGAPPPWSRPSGAPTRSCWKYIKGYGVFLPYLWPSKDRKLQIMVIMCFVLVLAQRVINQLVPDQLGRIVDHLEHPINGNPWSAICIGPPSACSSPFVLSKDSMVCLEPCDPRSGSSYHNTRTANCQLPHLSTCTVLAWISTSARRQVRCFRRLGRGSSINTFLGPVTFSVVPMLLDLSAAIVYFRVKYDAYYALVIAIVPFWLIYLTMRMAQWRTGVRREIATPIENKMRSSKLSRSPSNFNILTGIGTTQWFPMRQSSTSTLKPTSSNDTAMPLRSFRTTSGKFSSP